MEQKNQNPINENQEETYNMMIVALPSQMADVIVSKGIEAYEVRRTRCFVPNLNDAVQASLNLYPIESILFYTNYDAYGRKLYEDLKNHFGDTVPMKYSTTEFKNDKEKKND